MKLLHLIVVIFVCCLSAVSQTHGDTLFMDKNWNKSIKENAIYYRLEENKEGKFIVRDYYYPSNVVQMKAVGIKTPGSDTITFHGKCVYYHPNGKKSSEGIYRFNNRIGEWNWYTEKGRPGSVESFDDTTYVTYSKTSFRPQNQSSLFIMNAGYRFKLNKEYISSGHGLSMEFGFNAGYFISQKLLLAPFVGLGFADRFYNTAFTDNYKKDFNSSLDMSNLYGNDSVVVAEYKHLINGNHYFHEKTGYFGLMIKLPYKYVPVIKLYRGFSSLSYKTGLEVLSLKPAPEPGQNRTDNDYFDISGTLQFGAEVFLFTGLSTVSEYSGDNHTNNYLNDVSKRKRYQVSLFRLSAYFEVFDYSKASFSYDDGIHAVDVPFSKVMSQNFMRKYKNPYNIGLRLSFGMF